MTQRRSWRLALCAAMLILSGCAPKGMVTGCGTLVKNCGDGKGDQVVMRGVRSLSQSSQDNRRAYEVFDCAMDEWLEGSASANCILRIE